MKADREWWEEPGVSAGLTDALRRFHRSRRGAPTEADLPPPSTFPATPASREAMRLARENKRKFKS